MLRNRDLDDKTYEELLAEAMMQIPLYAREWTNFNPSDPGITILENLTAFQALQQNRIGQITPAVRQGLLKLAGFEAKKGRCARLLLKAEGMEAPLALPMNQKFRLGELCYETDRAIHLSPYHVMGIYSVRSGKAFDCSYLADREVEVPAYPFGETPKAGDSFWITVDGLPAEGEELLFYLAAADDHHRNPCAHGSVSAFATLKWECYTEQGFEEMDARDDTECFLISGEVRLRMPSVPAIPCPEAPDGGYALRATLVRAEYDVRPRLVSVDGFLFEVWQKDTLAACYIFPRASEAKLLESLMKDIYLMVFAKEEEGASYRRYWPGGVDSGPGRFYEERSEGGMRIWSFDRQRFGYGPGEAEDAVRIVAYKEEMMRRYFLGVVLGMDHQAIVLPAVHLVPESFCIIAMRSSDEGEEVYDFVKPESRGEDSLWYHLYGDEGRIVIEDAGGFLGARLYVGNLSVTAGKEGNVRPGNEFWAVGLEHSVTFYNPNAGAGGCFRESLEEVRERFLQDLRTPYTAVTAEDYERLVRDTPGLCIHKVKAYTDQKLNLVRIVVKPETDEPFPGLSKVYREAIRKQLEDKRLLTTRIEIVPPVYLPVDIRGMVYVKRQYEDSRQMIEAAIRRRIDYIQSERNFGEALEFDELFHEIELLDCVESIYELSMHPHVPGLSRLREGDILPAQNCLCYPGELTLEIGTYGK